jgi:hypothetical protein
MSALAVSFKGLDKLLTKRRGENPAGRLLVMPDESRIVTLIDQLDAVLEATSIQKNSFGEYSVYTQSARTVFMMELQFPGGV